MDKYENQNYEGEALYYEDHVHEGDDNSHRHPIIININYDEHPLLKSPAIESVPQTEMATPPVKSILDIIPASVLEEEEAISNSGNVIFKDQGRGDEKNQVPANVLDGGGKKPWEMWWAPYWLRHSVFKTDNAGYQLNNDGNYILTSQRFFSGMDSSNLNMLSDFDVDEAAKSYALHFFGSISDENLNKARAVINRNKQYWVSGNIEENHNGNFPLVSSDYFKTYIEGDGENINEFMNATKDFAF